MKERYLDDIAVYEGVVDGSQSLSNRGSSSVGASPARPRHAPSPPPPPRFRTTPQMRRKSIVTDEVILIA